jgi:cation-transporting ATPase 13A2
MFAGIMIGMSLITTTINYIMLRLSFVKIKEIAEHSVEIRVVRDGQKQTINSTELVPGDIFEPDEVIPCDCVLLKGEIYVN